MTDTAKKLTRQQQNCLDTIRGYGEVGATFEDLKDAMDLTRASLYRHVDRLEEYHLIRREFKGKDRRVFFVAGGFTSMHFLPPMGEIIPSRSIAKVLGDWKYAKHIAQWSAIREYIYYFPHSLSLMAQNAKHWHEGGEFAPDKKEIERQRRKILAIGQHAKHISMMCESLLANEALWDRKLAYNVWFMDQEIPFNAETATQSHSNITVLLNEALTQAKGPVKPE